MATFTVTNTNDSGAGSLRQAITSADASTGKNIINFCGLFDDGLAHTISLTGGGLSITDDIIILGRNPNLLTISDDSASRVFDITSGATATVNGLTITNSYNSAGGGGGISNEGVLTLNNSIITGNTVTNNATDQYGHLISAGGGIYNTGSLVVNYSTISNNSVDGNSVENEGGGIYEALGGIITVTNSTISGNTASAGYGGGIYTELGTRLTVSDSTIADNQAHTGGGIYNAGTLTVGNSAIKHNKVFGIELSSIDYYESGYGGGIYNVADGANVTVNYSTISDNSAENGSGGGIFTDTPLSVSNSTICGNSAENGVGGGIGSGNPSATVTVSNSTISGNSAEYGGGICFGSGSVTNSIIIGNSAQNGGGIYVSYSGEIITVTNSTIIGNSAQNGGLSGVPGGPPPAGYGGGIYNSLGTGLIVSDSTIADNQAQIGGGIYNGGTLTVDNSTIKHNKAFGIELSSGVYQSGDGGGIYNNSSYDGTTTVDYSTIAFNFDTSQEYSNYRISPDDIAGNFINNGYNWIGTTK